MKTLPDDDMKLALEHGYSVSLEGNPSERRQRAHRFQRLLYRWLDRPTNGMMCADLKKAMDDHLAVALAKRLVHASTPPLTVSLDALIFSNLNPRNVQR